MINSRQKGAAAERELCSYILDETGVKLVRNLEQSRSGGHDLTVEMEIDSDVATWLRRFAIEVKRHKEATPKLMAAWWAQAVEQAGRAGKEPLLAYRADRREWRIVMPLSVTCPSIPTWQGIEWTIETSLAAFCAMAREAV
jgi:Holliday junction resolvase